MIATRRGKGKHEVARRTELRRQGRQATQVGFEMFERFLVSYSDHHRGAARADNAKGATRVEVVVCQRERIEYRQSLTIIQLAAERRRALPDRNTAILINTPYLNIDEAGLRFLT